jgi:hypothetical protein
MQEQVRVSGFHFFEHSSQPFEVISMLAVNTICSSVDPWHIQKRSDIIGPPKRGKRHTGGKERMSVLLLETDPARMATLIDDALYAIEQRVGSTVRMDQAENEAIESARNGLAVMRGEWFGGLAESMRD